MVPSGGRRFDVLGAEAAVADLDGPSVRARLSWTPGVFDHTYCWQERGKTTGFPWFGRMDAIAIEPASQRHDHVLSSLGTLRLAPDATITATVTLDVGPVDVVARARLRGPLRRAPRH